MAPGVAATLFMSSSSLETSLGAWAIPEYTERSQDWRN